MHTSSLSISPRIEPIASQVLDATGAEIVVRALERQGVSLVAGVPGGAALPLYDALARCSRIRHVLARHEQAAGFIAQGMARLTQQPAVCLATSGPGVTNMLTALADAKMDSVPIICITGQVPQHLIGTDAFQEVATVELAKPITKAAWMATHADELEDLIAEAFRIAITGRPGPVLIDIPKDVQLMRSSKRTSRAADTNIDNVARLARDHASVDAAVKMIEVSMRPILYIGGGVVKARAEQALQRIAELQSIPVASTLMALGSMPHAHPLNLGMLGMHGAVATNRAIHECDLLIAIGARFDDRATGNLAQFAPNAKIVHVDIDARELGKIVRPTLAIQSDAWTFLTALHSRLQASERTDWLNRIRGWQVEGVGETSPAQKFITNIAEHLPKDAVITTDVGQHQMWVAQSFPFARADRWLTSGGLGTMGFGLPAAIGAALADPDATVICFTGDGSLLMNIQELATLAELDLNVKIVVFDNGGYGLVHQQQTLFYERMYSASRFIKPSDFVQIARGFGIAATDIEADGAACGGLLKQRGPQLLRMPIAQHAMALPMVPPGAPNIHALTGVD